MLKRLQENIVARMARRNRKKGVKKTTEITKPTTNPSSNKSKPKVKRKETYSRFIYKVLKKIHPDTDVSSKAMGIINAFVNDRFERAVIEALRLVEFNEKSTISSEIQCAIKLLVSLELAKHTVSDQSRDQAH